MLDIVDHGPVRELRLARPPANALDGALIRALRGALAEAPAAGARALVLSGAPGRFSGGLDVPALLRLDRDGVRVVWWDFFGLLEELARAPIPVVAAVTGHSPAGGAVMTLFADHRVMAQGAYVIGLNEVQVGLPVPAFLLRALTYLVGARHAEHLAVTGRLLAPEEALRVGLVDELAPVPDVVPRAIAWAEELLRRPTRAMSETRALARRPLREAFHDVDNMLVQTLVERWFSDETQTALRGLAARLGKA
jgi:enoyl-CoA hydratase/carnithine racemase